MSRGKCCYAIGVILGATSVYFDAPWYVVLILSWLVVFAIDATD